MSTFVLPTILILFSTSLGAETLLSLDQPIQPGIPGSPVAFSGTIFNSGLSDVFLNGASANLGYAELNVDFSDFFSVVPPTLAAGASYSGPIFSVDVSGLALSGDYFGTFTLQGGGDMFAIDDLATAGFQVSVSTVPEPASSSLCLLMLACGGVARLIRRR